MGDDLGEEWWEHQDKPDAPEVKETTKEAQVLPTVKTKPKAEKRKSVSEKSTAAKKKKVKLQQDDSAKKTKDEEQTQPKKRRKKKKKTISDVLAASEPKPGSPSDLQDMVTQYFSDKRSVIEREELQLQNSFFLSSNDLTHSLSSYLKLVCPKWAKLQKQHTEKNSVIVLIVCSSALRTIELIKQLTTFKGEAKVLKLFAKHIKIEEQMKLLQKGITHIAVGTPGRISALLEKEGLNMKALRYLVLDWNWRDQKLRRMVDIPEVKLDVLRLLESNVLTACKEDKVKIGLF